MMHLAMATWAVVTAGLVQPEAVQPKSEAPAQPVTKAPARPAPKPGAEVIEGLRAEAERLRPLVEAPLPRAFLDAVGALPVPTMRTVWWTKDRSAAYTPNEYVKLTPAQQAELVRRDCTPEFFYYTGYGSPLIYARPLQVLAERLGLLWRPRRVFDFGYGSIGHLRLMASLGVEAHGVEVEALFRAMYAEAGDTGVVPGVAGAADRKPADGRLALHHGSWPGDARVKEAIGGGYDLFISKNVLKKSYIHPERPVDEKYLVKLGVEDAEFVRAMYEVLAPGGVALIYNIAPAQNPPDKPYLAHADGRSPFPRELFEKAGFEVLAFDENDSAAIHKVWVALGVLGKGETEADLPKTLFAHYTLLRKPIK